MVKWCDITAFTHDKFQKDLLLDGELLIFWALHTDHPPKKAWWDIDMRVKVEIWWTNIHIDCIG